MINTIVFPNDTSPTYYYIDLMLGLTVTELLTYPLDLISIKKIAQNKGANFKQVAYSL